MCFFRTGLLLIVVLLACYAQSQQPPQPQDHSIATKSVSVTNSPPPPSTDDAPIPDKGAIPVPNSSSTPIKRVLRRLDPNCLDAAFHVCWSSPSAHVPLYGSYEQRRVAEDLELGNVYLKKRNYRGAQFRFEDALRYEPDNAEATFKLAEAHKNLGHNAEACAQYKTYLDTAPAGPFADRAKRGLQKLMPCP